MANLSQQKRQRMLEFLQTIREEHKDDDDVLIALGEIESELNAKKYGLVWEQHEEAVDLQMRANIPVFTECTDKETSGRSSQSRSSKTGCQKCCKSGRGCKKGFRVFFGKRGRQR